MECTLIISQDFDSLIVDIHHSLFFFRSVAVEISLRYNNKLVYIRQCSQYLIMQPKMQTIKEKRSDSQFWRRIVEMCYQRIDDLNKCDNGA